MPMTALHSFATAYDKLLRTAHKAKIVVLHPESRWRSLVLARLLGDERATAYYYALDVDDSNLFSFLIGLTNALSKQHATFGRHLNLLPSAVLNDPRKHLNLVLDAMLKELAEMAPGEFLLVLDEFDRADRADDIHRFIERLSHFMPDRCTIVLNGRSLPRLPWLAMMAKRKGLILRDEELVTKNVFGRPNPAGASLRALSIGPGFVFFNNRLIDSWEGHLPRLLLFFVLDRPEVTRNHICETFWPELDIEQAVNVFHVTKRRLHKALGIDVLSHDGAYYRINPDIACYFDAQDFVETLLAARHGSERECNSRWQRIAQLYRGPFLHGHDETWVMERRAAYRLAYVEALERIADNWIERGNQEMALLTLDKAIAADFSQESLHLRRMRLFMDLDRRAEAVAGYQDLETWAKASNKPLSGCAQELFLEITA